MPDQVTLNAVSDSIASLVAQEVATQLGNLPSTSWGDNSLPGRAFDTAGFNTASVQTFDTVFDGPGQTKVLAEIELPEEAVALGNALNLQWVLSFRNLPSELRNDLWLQVQWGDTSQARVTPLVSPYSIFKDAGPYGGQCLAFDGTLIPTLDTEGASWNSATESWDGYGCWQCNGTFTGGTSGSDVVTNTDPTTGDLDLDVTTVRFPTMSAAQVGTDFSTPLGRTLKLVGMSGANVQPTATIHARPIAFFATKVHG